MSKLLLLASCVAALGCGCATQPLRNPDSLDNPTLLTWTVRADFNSGLRHAYEQGPQSLSDFGVMSRGPMPMLTNLLVTLHDSPQVHFSLSSKDISKLRRATQGGLTLVVYEDGLVCLSTDLKRSLEAEFAQRGHTREDYFGLLKSHAGEARRWTRATLDRP